MPEHCTTLNIEHPDAVAQGITEWIEANNILDRINTVVPFTVTEPVSNLSSPNGQPQVRYVFKFIIFWTSKPASI